MVEFAESPFNIPIEFSDVSSRTWRQIAAPGAWWTAEQRVGIAGAARAARNGDPADAGGLPDAVIAVAEMVGGAPAHTSRVWVEEVVESIGELHRRPRRQHGVLDAARIGLGSGLGRDRADL